MSSAKKRFLLISGKRKTAIARAIVKPGSGRVSVNRIPIEVYTPEIAKMKIMEPLALSGDAWKGIDINVKVQGGGFMGQAEASRMAIARSILKWTKSSEIKKVFTKYDKTMVAGDSRRTEPKKFGGPSARTRKQKSYR
ncbi:MAG TPA: 30S ribosomal protein S9 [archaeon]|nr:30S ribosomal protein S9 [archaeon]